LLYRFNDRLRTTRPRRAIESDVNGSIPSAVRRAVAKVARIGRRVVNAQGSSGSSPDSYQRSSLSRGGRSQGSRRGPAPGSARCERPPLRESRQPRRAWYEFRGPNGYAPSAPRARVRWDGRSCAVCHRQHARGEADRAAGVDFAGHGLPDGGLTRHGAAAWDTLEAAACFSGRCRWACVATSTPR
jgi:hypothetical protein